MPSDKAKGKGLDKEKGNHGKGGAEDDAAMDARLAAIEARLTALEGGSVVAPI